MKYRVVRHPDVLVDLLEIAFFVQEKSGLQVAERRIDDIEAAIRSLEIFPCRGTLRNEIAPGLRAILAGRRAVMTFVVDNEAHRVMVRAVAYAGADWEERALKRLG